MIFIVTGRVWMLRYAPRMKLSKPCFAFAFLVLSCASAFALPFTPAADLSSERDVGIPMRDGVVLRADVLRPRGDGRFPVLVYRTPYGKEFALKEYSTFRHAVERGYAVVVEDVRGRYASGGEFLPYQNEGRDGYDTIEWAARQPWSNGAVGTFGLSYPGAVQWLAAVEDPPHLKAMVPAMTFSTPQNFFYSGGVWDMSWMEWIWDNIAPDVRVRKNLPGPKTYEEAIAAWETVGPKMLGTLPLNQLEELRGIAPYYYDWLSHPPDDPWWDWCELHNKYGRVHAAVLNLSGWYDDNYGPEGAIRNFWGLGNARLSPFDARNHLLIGPWVHGVDATGKTRSGEREFGPTAAIDYDEVVLRWMDHHVRGIDNGVDKERPVRYFVMGSNEWHEGIGLPVSKPTTYYLGNAGRSAKPGGLSTEPVEAKSGYSSFVSDPSKPVINKYQDSGAHDYREPANRDDVLVFDSAPFDRDTEVTGGIFAAMFLSCNCRDTDLWVRVLDLAPDGTAFNLMSPGLDVQRASYHHTPMASPGAPPRELLTPGHIYQVPIGSLLTSNVFLKGHRLRVQISASFFPNFSRNLQNGELETTSSKMQKAEIRIYHNRRFPSRVILPIVPRSGLDRRRLPQVSASGIIRAVHPSVGGVLAHTPSD